MNFKKLLILLCVVSTFSINAQEKSIDENYVLVTEEMPYFKSEKCEKYRESDDRIEFKKCAEEAMWKFVYGKLKYPLQAKSACVAGTVVIRFVVRKNGNTGEEEIMRDIGAGCGEEALRVVKMMRKWVPGLMNGKPVSTHCNIPIKFSLRD